MEEIAYWFLLTEFIDQLFKKNPGTYFSDTTCLQTYQHFLQEVSRKTNSIFSHYLFYFINS